ncbi:hypothetical protein ACJRO7_003043 [Eucalyptus globulus]|uniref:Uncharacterized protein n=1 Tax=Eucalyptus globulus TaxID=34317 RepID=A0ABD3IUK7_EUCGL
MWGILRDRTNNRLNYLLTRLNLAPIAVFTVIKACHLVLRGIGMTKLAWFLLTGVTIDISMVLMTGENGLYAGVASSLMPLRLGLLGVVKHGASKTPCPVIACLLDDLKILNSELGRLGLSSELITDMLSTFLQLITTSAISGVNADKHLTAIRRVVGVLVYLAFVIENVYVFAIILYFLASSVIFHFAGISSFLAPFILANLVDKLDCFTTGVLLPLFITTRVMKAIFSEIHFGRDIVQVSSSMVPSLVLNLPKRDTRILNILNLLDAICLTKELTVALYGLHLFELIGRASRLYSHRMHKRTLIRSLYLENIVTAYSHYGQDHWDVVSAYVFTAFSLPRLMGKDICMLALDKLASFIAYLFIISGPRTIPGIGGQRRRILNSSALEGAPPSVGILVDCGRLGCSHSLLSSEQEALTLANRMANGTNITCSITNWDKMYDSEILNDVNNGSIGNRNVLYMREVGFFEWSEFLELVVIGDLLATTDVRVDFQSWAYNNRRFRPKMGRRCRSIWGCI